MKQKLLKTWLTMLCLLVIGAGNAWAEEVVYKTALFGSSYNSEGVNGYSNSWSATNDDFTVNLKNWNNYNNNWNYIKAGAKNTAYVGTITTATAIDKAVTKIVVTIDAITAKNINSIKLYSGNSSNDCTTVLATFDKSVGAKSVTISSPTANKFYKLSFDCKAADNGSVQVSKIEYYYDNSASGSGDGDGPSGNEKWKLVTSAPTSWEGQYIIVAKPDAGSRVLLNGAQTGFSSITPLTLKTTDFSESDGILTISTDVDPSFTVTESSTTGQYNIKGSSGTWLGGTSGDASFTNNQTNWVFEPKSDGKIWIRVYAESMSRAILYRNTPTFQHYATNNENNTGYGSVYLYKKYESDGPTKTTPTLSFSPATYNYTMGETFSAPELSNPQGVTVSYSSSVTSVADFEEGKLTIKAPGTTTITASFAGNETYNPNSASYTLNVAAAPLSTMDDIYAKAKEVGTTVTDVTIKFNNWVVTGVSGSSTFLTDGSKGLIIYGSSTGFSAGDVLSGTVNCQLNLYNGAANVRELKSNTTGLTVTTDGSVEPITVATSELSGAHSGVLLKYTNMTYNSNDKTLSDGSNTITPYTSLYNYGTTFINGKKYDVTGVYTLFYNNSTNEILPRSAEDIKLVEELNSYAVTILPSENGTLTIKDGETIIKDGDKVAEGTTLTIECTPTDAENYRYKNWQYKAEGMDAFATRTTTFTYTMPSANVQFKANFELIPTYTINWSVNGVIVKTDENVKQGAALTAPEVSAINGKNFIGWVTTPIVASDATPAYVDPATPNTAEPKEITYYAVFATVSGSDGTTTSTLSIENYATAHEWKTENKYLTATFGNITANISTTGTGTNSGKYYVKNQTITEDTWRIYQSESGSITLTSSNGNIKSVIVNYFKKESGSGDNKKYPTFLYDGNEVESGAKTTLDNASATFTVGGDGGNIQIHSIIVEYANGSAGHSDFTTLPNGGMFTVSAGGYDTPTEAYYATYYTDHCVTVPEGCEAASVNVHDNKMYLSYTWTAGSVIPANTGIIIKANAHGIYTYPIGAEDDATDVEGTNYLYGSTTAGTTTAPEEGNYKFYKLAKSGDYVGFYYGAAEGAAFNSGANKAYLAVPANVAANIKGFAFSDADDATAIFDVANDDNTEQTIYNLNGQRVNKAKKGIYIVNGKKVMFK